MTSSIDLKSTRDVEIRSIRADIATLSESISNQNEAIDKACNMALHAKNRSIDFSNHVTDLGHEIEQVRKQVIVWQNTCLLMAAWIMVFTLLFTFGVIG